MALAVTALAACAHGPRHGYNYSQPGPGSYYVVSVRSGDTLSQIARRHHVNEENLVAMNRLRNRHDLYVGQVLRIPAYGRVARGYPVSRPQPSTPTRTSVVRTAPVRTSTAARIVQPTPKPQRPRPTTTEVASTKPPYVSRADAVFAWPLDGVVLSSFGSRNNGERNDGINIACTGGEEIRAAGSGTVTYVGNELKGYGNLILIRHDNGFTSAYAHADQITVTKGDRVRQGQVIAYAGSTGDVAEPQLHFELRRGVTPVDPRPYLRTYGS